MGLLLAGIIIWSLVHLSSSVAPQLKTKLVKGMGENPYKLSYTVLLLASLALIIFGWRSTTATFLYQLPNPTRHVAMLLILVGFVLFGASNYPSRIKRFIRHPQLTGVVVWALAHLVMNGDNRSVLLFGGMALWAILEIVFINRRDREWDKPAKPGWAREIRGAAISIVIFVAVMFIHPYMTGVPII